MSDASSEGVLPCAELLAFASRTEVQAELAARAEARHNRIKE
jgi:hypothetical protein